MRDLSAFALRYLGLAFIPSLLILAFVFRMFPFQTTYVLRFRLITGMLLPYFAVLVTASVVDLMPGQSVRLGLRTASQVVLVGLLLIIPFCGALRGYPLKRRIGATALFCVTSLLAVLFTYIAVVIIGVVALDVFDPLLAPAPTVEAVGVGG